MVNDKLTIIQSIDRPMLTTLARRALHREDLQILNWTISQLGGGAGNPVSVGLYRIECFGQDRDEQAAWSVILKILQSPANVGWENMGEGGDQTHWNYWRREVLVYQSGWLNTLPDGMAAPRCYHAAELPGNIAMLWLEDIRDTYMEGWPLERYALTARHLGRLNGMYLSGIPFPAYPWLSRQRSRQWTTGMPSWRTLPWDHPMVLKRYPRPEINFFRRMLSENDRFLAKLDLLPQAISHGDTYPTNFMSRDLINGQQQTVALDWALMGVQPVGDDLGQFVFGALTNLKTGSKEDITETLFEAYLEGLRDNGSRVDPQLVRFGFVTSAALRVGLFQIYLLGESLAQGGTNAESDPEFPPVQDCFEVNMANEAYQLLELMG